MIDMSAYIRYMILLEEKITGNDREIMVIATTDTKLRILNYTLWRSTIKKHKMIQGNVV